MLQIKLNDNEVYEVISNTSNFSINSHIYVMKCVDYYKIGVAYNPEFRVKELQVGNPFLIELITAFEIRKDILDVFEIENKIHKELINYTIRGEWFNCNINKIINVIQIVINDCITEYTTIKNSEIEILDKFPDNKLIVYSDNPEVWNKMKINQINFFQDYYKDNKLFAHGYIISQNKFDLITS
jgi:hypothetical protein